jgi:hypothetical protein
MAASVADIKSIFGKALEQSSAGERQADLDQACQGNPLDGGQTSSGRPYFVMELGPGHAHRLLRPGPAPARGAAGADQRRIRRQQSTVRE